jgi:hypothetical protein
MDYVLTSLDMFIGTTENLINYSFNVRLLQIHGSLADTHRHADDI